jgi:diguanylate cyclase (GGDEF)-like protein
VNAEALMRALATLSRDAKGEFAVEDMLRQLCEAVAEAMDIAGAGVMIVDGSGLRFVHSDGVDIDRVERLQELLQTGPCRDAAVERREVVIDDLRVQLDGRWPEFGIAAESVGLRSMIALPLVSRQRTWGVLDLYDVRPGPWLESEVAAARVLADVAVSYIVMAADRDAARQAQRELSHRNMHDELTGLPNRALLFDRLAHALTSAARRDRLVAVLFVDLDRFKQVNDTLGHAAGDAVLRAVGTRMATTLRDADTLARLAGDEFVLICEDLPQRTRGELDEQVQRVVDRLRRVITQPIAVAGVEVVITASIGISLSAKGATADELLGEADSAMYDAKQHRNRDVVVRDRFSRFDRENFRHLDRELADAIGRGELRLHYQPMVSSEDRSVVAVEALLRWNHPRHGLLPAGVFIATAESTGVIGSIGHWVVDQACGQMAEWRSELERDAPPTCYINLSAREVSDPTLDRAIVAALDHYHLDSHQLGLEVVESAFADPLIAPVLDTYRDRGHPLSVDDFGTGYSSLSSLVELPIDIAKIDYAFVADIPANQRHRALIDAVIVVARDLDLRVVGEGVEAENQASYLEEVGCDLLQGFHIAAPQPGHRLTAEWSQRVS